MHLTQARGTMPAAGLTGMLMSSSMKASHVAIVFCAGIRIMTLHRQMQSWSGLRHVSLPQRWGLTQNATEVLLRAEIAAHAYAGLEAGLMHGAALGSTDSSSGLQAAAQHYDLQQRGTLSQMVAIQLLPDTTPECDVLRTVVGKARMRCLTFRYKLDRDSEACHIELT